MKVLYPAPLRAIRDMFTGMGYGCPGRRVVMVPFVRLAPMKRSRHHHYRLHPYEGHLPGATEQLLRHLEPTPADPLDVDISRAAMAQVYLRW